MNLMQTTVEVINDKEIPMPKLIETEDRTISDGSIITFNWLTRCIADTGLFTIEEAQTEYLRQRKLYERRRDAVSAKD
jgi:hypothetical protein